MLQRLFVLLPMLASAAAGAQAQEPIVAERPGFSASPFTIEPGTVQIEAGYEYVHDGAGADFDSHTLPLMLVRLGLVDDLELQLAWTGYSWAEVGNDDIDGVRDAQVGVKWQITDSRARLPVSLFAGVNVPIGDDPFTSDEVDPVIGAFWSYRAGIDWFGTVTLGEPDDDTVLRNAVGASLPLTAELGSYVEYFGFYGGDGGDGGPEHFLNGGITYLPQLNLQLDAQVGFGLNSRAADLFLGGGVAYRF